MPKYAQPVYYSRGAANRAVIAEGLSKGLENFLQGLAVQQQRKQDEEIMQAMQDPNLTPIQKATLAAKLSQQSQKALLNVMTLEDRFKREREVAERHQSEHQFKQDREQRLKIKDLQGAYTSRIKQLNSDFKESVSPIDRKQIKAERDSLMKEMSKNLARMRKGEQPVFELLDTGEAEPLARQAVPIEGMNQLAGPQKQMPMQSAALQSQQHSMSQRQKWDPRNPQHQARALQVLEAAKGDRALANQALSEEFER